MGLSSPRCSSLPPSRCDGGHNWSGRRTDEDVTAASPRANDASRGAAPARRPRALLIGRLHVLLEELVGKVLLAVRRRAPRRELAREAHRLELVVELADRRRRARGLVVARRDEQQLGRARLVCIYKK